MTALERDNMTEQNEQAVKLAIQKLREVNQPERELSKVTPGTKRMAPWPITPENTGVIGQAVELIKSGPTPFGFDIHD